ncbi:MAG: hypothetical protein CL467_03500 [Acidimicrobiaceae bacterium]|nr:hypothetical protein [Acidimicrobiaceae bacterium]|tara:strand:- start:2820 stop:3530 length:711 start_codon:yes stop_codon:yes gene_type:complete
MIHTLLVGTGTFVESLKEGLKAQGHVVACVEPTRSSDTNPHESDLDSPAIGIKDAAEQLGHTDLIVHVPAAPDEPKKIVNQTEDEWIIACEAPLHEAIAVARASHPILAVRPNPCASDSNARLIWVLPTIALGGSAGYVASGAAFEGIRALSKGAAKQWGADGITTFVLAVNPTVFLGNNNGPSADGVRDAAVPALGRTGDPVTDLAPLLDLLANPKAAFTTGGTIVADGGIWMAL